MNVTKAPEMNIRRHAGGLDDSMKTVARIPATKAAVQEYMLQRSRSIPFTQEELESVEVEERTPAGPDTRIGWDRVFMVMYTPCNSADPVVYGMCDRQLVG